MDQLIKEVQDYSAGHGIHPSTVIQRAGCGGGKLWERWLGGASCTLNTADKLRAYMAANPAPAAVADDHAGGVAV